MTAIFYPDLDASSTSGRFTLEARSPHNGSIPHRDGQPCRDEFPFKYRQHQSEFRYRLFDNSGDGRLQRLVGRGRRLVWERWQVRDEDSPHQLLVSDDGWSLLRTHGFRPELVAVSPRGADAVRVRITAEGMDTRPAAGKTPTFDWSAARLQLTTAGAYWTAHSWPYFLRFGDTGLFAWRTWCGQRLVIDLGRARQVTDDEQGQPPLALALAQEERRGAQALLEEIASKGPQVRATLARLAGRDPDEEWRADPLTEKLGSLTAAIHLVGVYRLDACLGSLRGLEDIDLPSGSTGSEAMPNGWWLEVQAFRPILHHALRRLGAEPQGFAAYNFTNFGDNCRRRFPLPERVAGRQAKVAGLDRSMSAEEVLRLAGSPDHVRKRSRKEGRIYKWSEDWEYDHLAGAGWVTTRLTWDSDGRRGRMTALDAAPSYWVDSAERESEILQW